MTIFENHEMDPFHDIWTREKGFQRKKFCRKKKKRNCIKQIKTHSRLWIIHRQRKVEVDAERLLWRISDLASVPCKNLQACNLQYIHFICNYACKISTMSLACMYYEFQWYFLASKQESSKKFIQARTASHISKMITLCLREKRLNLTELVNSNFF